MKESDYLEVATRAALDVALYDEIGDGAKRIANMLFNAYKQGVKDERKRQAKNRKKAKPQPVRSYSDHTDWCSSEHCVGQCRVR